MRQALTPTTLLSRLMMLKVCSIYYCSVKQIAI
jgi:hypothetical protein